MAIRSGLFDSTEIIESADGYPRGNKAENAEFFARYFASFIGNGIYAKQTGAFQVFEHDGLTVRIAAGACFINGYFAFDDADTYITLTSGVDDKIHRIVMRLDTYSGEISMAVLDGEISLTRNGGIYEIALADISVRAENTVIYQSDIIDLRADSDLCGFVTGVVDQLDTSVFFAQLDDVIENAEGKIENIQKLIEASEKDFDSWFENIKNKFYGSAAGYLDENKANRDLSNVDDGSVVRNMIADGAVTSEKIADQSISSEKLAFDVRSLVKKDYAFAYGIRFI